MMLVTIRPGPVRHCDGIELAVVHLSPSASLTLGARLSRGVFPLLIFIERQKP